MKKFYSLLIASLLAIAAMSQTTTHWTGFVSSDWQVAGNWDNGVPNTNTEIAVFNTGTTLTVINAPTATIGGLIVTANTDLTLSHTAVRTLTVANNTGTDLTVDAGSELTLGTNINITLANNAAATIDGILTINAGRTYNTNGTGVNTTVNGTIDNSGTVNCANAAKLSLSNGATYIHAVNNVSLPTATWNTGSLLDVTGVTATALSGLNQDFSDITWECASQTVANMRFNEMTSVRNLKIVSTGTGSLRVFSVGGTAAIPTAGNVNDFEMSGGTLNLSIGGGIGQLNVAGNFTMSGGTISETSTGSGQINFAGTSVQTYSKSGGAISNTINVNINSNAIVDFGTSVLNGSTGTFTLNAGGKIITSNSNGLSATGSVQITAVYNSGADYEFQGVSTGTFTTTPTASTVRNLVVNNTTGDVTLAQPLAVTADLTLTSGALVTTTTNLVTVNAGGTTSGSSYVSGPMAKVGNTAFTFPVGKSGAGLHTVGITAPSASSTIRAEYFRGDPHTFSSTYGGTITQISGCEYWTMSRTAGTGTGRAILSWASNSSCNGAGYVSNISTLRVARLSGSWQDDGSFSVTGNSTAGTLTANATSAFSFTFALGTSTPDNPLPVMFADVRAFEKNSGVQIEWSNLTERDLTNYVVERSTNGQDFAVINQQLPKSNQNDKASYVAFDASPVPGTNFYRIKAFEISGKKIYSNIMKVIVGGKQQGLVLYPNPATGGQVSVSLNVKQGVYTLRVVNASGQEVYNQKINHQGGSITQSIQLPSSVKPGFYNMIVSSSDYRESKMFVVQ